MTMKNQSKEVRDGVLVYSETGKPVFNEPSWHPAGTVDINEESRPAFYTLAVYLVDRSYGGPEEGGWWFDNGTRIDELILDSGTNVAIPKIFTDEDEAWHVAEAIQKVLDEDINKGRRPISSVLSEGIYRAEVHDGYPPEYWPERRRPHYE